MRKQQKNYENQKQENEKIAVDLKTAVDKFNNLQAEIEKLKEGGDADQVKKLGEQLEEALDSISDIEGKMVHPASAINDEQQKKALEKIAMNAVGAFVKTKSQQTDFF